MVFNLENTENSIYSVDSDTEIVLSLRCDIMNICGEIAKRMFGKNEGCGIHQAEIALALCEALEEMAYTLKDYVTIDAIGKNYTDGEFADYQRKVEAQIPDARRWEEEYGKDWWKEIDNGEQSKEAEHL